MGAKDSMKLNPDGTININVSIYRGKGFVDAIKVNELANFLILGRNVRKQHPGEPDVVITSATGEQFVITRKELVNNYRYLSGNRIRMAFIKENKRYTVFSNCNKQYAAMLLPSNMIGYLGNQRLQAGSYIVAPKNQDGSIDFSKITVVNRSLFRKLFMIPYQPVIQRNLGRPGSISNRVRNKISNTKSFTDGNGRLGNNSVRTERNSIRNGNSAGVALQKQAPAQCNTTRPMEKVVRPNKYNYRAIGKCENDSGVIVGYLIEDIRGQKKPISVAGVMEMCAKHQIANLMLQTKENGQSFLRGNGISIESLPRYIV